jgi:hypothetical protein
MDTNKVMNVKAVADDILTVDLLQGQKSSQLPALEEWEMVLVGGGEFIPCW